MLWPFHTTAISASAAATPLTGKCAATELRAQFEKLVEIHQHKGSSECYPGSLYSDESCNFEIALPIPIRDDLRLNKRDLTEQEKLDIAKGYVRPTLAKGLRMQTVGINPNTVSSAPPIATLVSPVAQRKTIGAALSVNGIWSSKTNKFTQLTILAGSPRSGQKKTPDKHCLLRCNAAKFTQPAGHGLNYAYIKPLPSQAPLIAKAFQVIAHLWAARLRASINLQSRPLLSRQCKIERRSLQ